MHFTFTNLYNKNVIKQIKQHPNTVTIRLIKKQKKKKKTDSFISKPKTCKTFAQHTRNVVQWQYVIVSKFTKGIDVNKFFATDQQPKAANNKRRSSSKDSRIFSFATVTNDLYLVINWTPIQSGWESEAVIFTVTSKKQLLLSFFRSPSYDIEKNYCYYIFTVLYIQFIIAIPLKIL